MVLKDVDEDDGYERDARSASGWRRRSITGPTIAARSAPPSPRSGWSRRASTSGTSASRSVASSTSPPPPDEPRTRPSEVPRVETLRPAPRRAETYGDTARTGGRPRGVPTGEAAPRSAGRDGGRHPSAAPPPFPGPPSMNARRRSPGDNQPDAERLSTDRARDRVHPARGHPGARTCRQGPVRLRRMGGQPAIRAPVLLGPRPSARHRAAARRPPPLPRPVRGISRPVRRVPGAHDVDDAGVGVDLGAEHRRLLLRAR